MSRRPRHEFEGGIYHIIQRGNNKEYIFDGDRNKEYLLNLLRENKMKFGFNLFGYVIMNNHYHLILRQGEIPLRVIMHRVNHTYSRTYNVRNERTGHVFENRYTSILVADEAYLFSLLRYIHQNPVTAKICAQARAYPWSSDWIYRSNRIHNDLVDIEFVFELISSDRRMALRMYAAYMDVHDDSGAAEDEKRFERIAVIGERSDEGDPDLQADAEAGGRGSEGESGGGGSGSRASGGSEDGQLDDILWSVVEDRETFAMIKKGSRKHSLSSYKKQFVESGLERGYSMETIGRCIALSKAAIFRIHHNGQTD